MFLILFTDYRNNILLFAVLVAFFCVAGRILPNFFYGIPVESQFRSRDVQPTPYPPSFRMQFDTNISRPDASSLNKPINSMLYYDSAIPAQRIDHGAGAYECVRFYNVTTHGCQLYFLKNGMYRVITPDAIPEIPTTKKSQPCCLDIAGLGPPPPDWAQQAAPSFKGLKQDRYSGFDSYEFVFDNPPNLATSSAKDWHQYTSLQLFGMHFDNIPEDPGARDVYEEYHTAREVHDGNPLRNGIPLTFTFPSKAKGIQDFHFDPNSLVVGHQDARLFQLPDGCEEIVCDQSGYWMKEHF